MEREKRAVANGLVDRIAISFVEKFSHISVPFHPPQKSLWRVARLQK